MCSLYFYERQDLMEGQRMQQQSTKGTMLQEETGKEWTKNFTYLTIWFLPQPQNALQFAKILDRGLDPLSFILKFYLKTGSKSIF